MSNRFSPCRHPLHRNGLTLVEVVVGLVLLASLAVSVLLSLSKHQRQIRMADKRLRAVELAEEMLAGWYGQAQRVPENASGTIRRDQRQWRWQTEVVRTEILPAVAVPIAQPRVGKPGTAFQVIRLSIFADNSRDADCSVELLQAPLLSTGASP